MRRGPAPDTGVKGDSSAMLAEDSARGHAASDRRTSHVTLVRPAAVSSRRGFTVGVVPPLGMAYLAGALRAAGHRVDVIDAVGEAPFEPGDTAHPDLVSYGLGFDEIIDRIDPATDAIAVSVMFSQQWPHADAMIRAIHARFPDVPIFAGGEHVTAAPEFVLDSCPPVTACGLGEGEETIVDLADHVA